jgi:serine/threonine protein kinase
MGEVYRAGTPVWTGLSLKVSNQQFTERFASEARAVAALNHPNICQLYDVGPNYLVMEYIEGVPLASQAHGLETPRKLVDIAVQIADGMAAAHAAGIIHRDLKPDNILVTGEGRVKILDLALPGPHRPPNRAATLPTPWRSPILNHGVTVPIGPEQARGAPVPPRNRTNFPSAWYWRNRVPDEDPLPCGLVPALDGRTIHPERTGFPSLRIPQLASHQQAAQVAFKQLRALPSSTPLSALGACHLARDNFRCTEVYPVLEKPTVTIAHLVA